MTFEWDDPDYTDRQPNKQDIEEVMCKFRIYLQDRLEVATSTRTSSTDTEDTEIQVIISNLDWIHSGGVIPETGTSNLALNLTTAAMYTTSISEEPVPPPVVIASLYGMETNLLSFIQIPSIPAAEADRPPTDENGDLVFGDRDDFVFAHAIRLNYQDYPLDTELASGSLRAIECGERIFDTPDRSILGDPLDLNNLPEPPEQANEEVEGEGQNDPTLNSTSPTTDDSTETPAQPTTPAGAPVTGPAGTVTGGQQRPTGQVSVNFIVSNLESITIPAEVNRSGIAAAFPIFADEIVSGLVALQAPSPGRRRLFRRRRLQVQVAPGSAYVGALSRTQCGESAHPDLVCHEAEASYVLENSVGSTASIVDETQYTLATYRAINDGTLYNVMKREFPDTPLFIGAIPPSEGSDSSNTQTVLLWVMVGLAGLFLCCSFCLCWYICYQRKLYEEELEYERALTDDIVDETGKLDTLGQHQHHYPPGESGGSGDRTEPMLDEEDGEEGLFDEEDTDDAFRSDFDNEAQLLALADAGYWDDNEAQLLALAENEEMDFEAENGTRLLAAVGAQETQPVESTSSQGTTESETRERGNISKLDDSESEDEEGLDWIDYDATDTNQREFPIAPAPPSIPLGDDSSEDEEDVNWEEYGGDELLASASAAGLASIPMVDELIQLSSSSGDDDVKWEEYTGSADDAGSTTAVAAAMSKGDQGVPEKKSSTSDENVEWEDYDVDAAARMAASTLDQLDSSSSDPEGADWEVYE